MTNMVAVEVKQKVMKQKAKLTHVWVTKVKVIHRLHCVRQVTLSHLRQWGQPKYMELVLEPDNPKDNRAIAFRFFLNGQWHKFGYVVSKLLDEVHTTISMHKIINITFKRIKYKT